MKNNVDLIACLPPFLTKYGEMKEILMAEEPEFSLLWDNTKKALYNQFITTADEKGVAGYERLLGLLPESSDSLEQRRSRIMNKWLAKLPYTYKALIERLKTFCGDDFSLSCDFENYSLRLLVHFREYSSFLEVKKFLREMLPANIYYVAVNSVSADMDGRARLYSSVALSRKYKRISVNVKR